MSRTVPHPAAALPTEVVDQAIDWSVRLDFNAASQETRRRFAEWLGRDPAHAEAWARVQSLRQTFAAVPAHMALPALDGAEGRRKARRAGRRQALRLLLLAGAGAAGGLGVYRHAPWQRLLADASTGIGEQRSLHMDDGTEVLLNTDSAVDTYLTAERRLVVLRRGEMRIITGKDAAHAPPRPFWARTRDGGLQALGTRFVVRLQPGHTLLAVQEGAVRLHPGDGPATATARPGETWRMTPDGAEPADTGGLDLGAWADGVVSARNLRLADLLRELARYRVGRIDCDTRVADLPVSGTFHIHDTDRTLAFLAQTYGLRLVYRTRFWVGVEPAAA